MRRFKLLNKHEQYALALHNKNAETIPPNDVLEYNAEMTRAIGAIDPDGKMKQQLEVQSPHPITLQPAPP
jgi:hypothetical protein